MQQQVQHLQGLSSAHTKAVSDVEHAALSAHLSLRSIELEVRDESVKLQDRLLRDKLAGTSEEKEILKRVLESSASTLQVSEFAREKEAHHARTKADQEAFAAKAAALNAQEAAFQAQKLEVEQQDTRAKDLEKQLHAALEKATLEQHAFEESSSERLKALQHKEQSVKGKLAELHAFQGDESKIEAILELKKMLANRDEKVVSKDKVIARLEKELRGSAATVRDTVDALVDKATESLVKDMTKLEDKIEKREELVSAQSSRLEAEMAKIQDIARGERTLREAETKLKRANEQLAANNKREEELMGLVKQIDREREMLRKEREGGGNSHEADSMATAFDQRIRSLNQQVTDLTGFFSSARASPPLLFFQPRGVCMFKYLSVKDLKVIKKEAKKH